MTLDLFQNFKIAEEVSVTFDPEVDLNDDAVARSQYERFYSVKFTSRYRFNICDFYFFARYRENMFKFDLVLYDTVVVVVVVVVFGLLLTINKILNPFTFAGDFVRFIVRFVPSFLAWSESTWPSLSKR